MAMSKTPGSLDVHVVRAGEYYARFLLVSVARSIAIVLKNMEISGAAVRISSSRMPKARGNTPITIATMASTPGSNQMRPRGAAWEFC